MVTGSTVGMNFTDGAGFAIFGKGVCMQKANKEIRQKLTESGLRMWQLADAVHVAESTLCSWMRRELTGERLERVQAALAELTGGKE